MLEKALVGSKKYYGWIFILLVIVGFGSLAYLYQLLNGLGITGMSRDVSWGLYIAQFTFLVGVAASAVMLVLPYYLHDYKAFGKITILGEFLAVSAIVMCITFVVVDLGRPDRLMNLLLHPSPRSILFWDIVVLSGYLILNIVIGWVVLGAERKEVPPPRWIKPFIYISIPWAVSIHTVTAYLISGLPGRGFWLTAIMAPRFLASAFAAGPALLLLFTYIIKRVTKFDAGDEAVRALSKIVAYAMVVNVFFIICEVFVTFYSQIPEHLHHFSYLYAGLHGHGALVPLTWTSTILAVISLILLVPPQFRNNPKILPLACIAVFFSIWIEKGVSLIVVGFIPSPLDRVFEYVPTPPELMIVAGVWALGFLILTLLYKIAITVKEEIAA
jgi:Ni/Fe-hydrogenase subunit HybB-like protein